MKNRFKYLTLLITLIISLSLVIPTFAVTGSIEVSCEGTRFTGEFAAGETGQLEITLFEGVHWDRVNGPMQQNEIIVLGEGPFDIFVPWTGVTDGNAYRVAIRVGHDPHAGVIAMFEEVLDCPPPPDGGFCSPGYFKKHLDAWGPTGYAPGDDFDTVFGVDYFDPDITLLDAVNAKGGGVNALARTGTASLLSAAHPGVNYALTVAEVIAAVQAGDKALLDQYIDFDCPID